MIFRAVLAPRSMIGTGPVTDAWIGCAILCGPPRYRR